MVVAQQGLRTTLLTQEVPHHLRGSVFDVVAGAFGEQLYVAMEFVEGKTLRQWLDAAPRSRREILDAFLAAGEGLAAVHRAGLVHRLDKDTTGLLVVARSLRAHTALVEQLQARAIEREYLAVVNGVPVAVGYDGEGGDRVLFCKHLR